MRELLDVISTKAKAGVAALAEEQLQSPKALRQAANMAFTSASLETSPPIASARPLPSRTLAAVRRAFSSLMSWQKIGMPSRASRYAVASPNPLPAPVITAMWSCISIMTVHSLPLSVVHSLRPKTRAKMVSTCVR